MFNYYLELLTYHPIIKNEIETLLKLQKNYSGDILKKLNKKSNLFEYREGLINKNKIKETLNDKEKNTNDLLEYLANSGAVSTMEELDADNEMEVVYLKVKHNKTHNHIAEIGINLREQKVFCMYIYKDILKKEDVVEKYKELYFSSNNLHLSTRKKIKGKARPNITCYIRYFQGQYEESGENNTLNKMFDISTESERLELLDYMFKNKNPKEYDIKIFNLKYELGVKKVPTTYVIDIEKLILNETFI